MKTNANCILSRNDFPISLEVLLEKKINPAWASANEGLPDIDKSVHKIRKSLRAMLAGLLLYTDKLKPAQYMSWEIYLKALIKQYATIRETYVNLQTFKEIEQQLKDLDQNSCIELGNYYESKYKLFVKENNRLDEIVKPLNKAFITISADIKNTPINSDISSLKKWHRKTFQKSKSLCDELTLSSSANDFHRFRKWARYFYFQQSLLDDAGLKKMNLKDNDKLHKLVAYLGDEHDLQLFYQGLKIHFAYLSEKTEPIFNVRIKRLRKKVLDLSLQVYAS